jgi:prevent-host-death family protein
MSVETTITVRDLREHLSEHIRHVTSGGSVVVTSRGQPVVRLVRVEPVQPVERPFGFMKGQIKMAVDFDDTPDDILTAINEDIFPPLRHARS